MPGVPKIALVVESDQSLSDLRAALARAGAPTTVHSLREQLDDGARRLAAELADDQIVVCDCSGERGCERAFFVVRAMVERPVVLLAVGYGVEIEAVEVLAAGLRKTWRGARMALVTDRVDEVERASGCAQRSGSGPAEWAQGLIRVVVDPESWTEAPRFRL